MKIKRFTDFILENEYYGDINEGFIVPDVPYNSTTSPGPGKLSVTSDKKNTQIGISKSAGGNSKNFSLFFFTSNKPLVEGKTKTYALVNAVRDGKTDELAAVTNMTDLTAKKSPQNYQIGANSIDLLVSFMQATGIAEDATLGANLAKVIAALLLDPMYKDKVTDTFIKFADNIIMNVNYNGFNSGMSDNFLSVMQSAGMKAFRTQLVKSYDALSKPKTADATKK